MNTAIAFVLGVNLTLIGALPKVFFKRDGKFNFMWWATATPFFAAALVLILTYLGLIEGVVTPVPMVSLLVLVLSLMSIALIMFTLGTHNRRIALWHQTNDSPEHIVTHGAYKYIRHPFYSSFLMALFALLILVPHISSALIFVYALVLLNHTAAREESYLSASQFGDEYRAYTLRSGRFIPKGNTTHA